MKNKAQIESTKKILRYFQFDYVLLQFLIDCLTITTGYQGRTIVHKNRGKCLMAQRDKDIYIIIDVIITIIKLNLT